MKKTFHSIKALLASGLLVASLGANAQTQTGLYNWPQNVDYAFGYKPSSASDASAKTAYDFWKANFLVDGASCGGSGAKRVEFDKVSGRFGISDNTTVSVSEGIAYGMLLAAYADEKGNFDALFKFYKANVNGNGIMNWGINSPSCAKVGENGATDAELDVAWALWVAHNQWGGGTTSQYLTDAKTLIKAIKDHEIDKTGNLNTLKPGDQFGGHGSGKNNLVNISYFSPAYYTVFGEITNDAAFWTSVYNRGYDIMEKAMDKNTGLVPDWCTSTGTVPAEGATQYDDKGVNFFYDAVRTPVRVALDYLWYGDQAPRALAYTKKVNNWLRGAHPNPATIGSKYSLTGTALQSFHNNSFVGPFTVCAMATDDINTGSYINSLYKDNVATNPTTDEYFNSSWKVISLFIATGNFYLPPPDLCDGPSLEPASHLCLGTGSPKTITLNSFLDGASKYEWKKDGAVIAGATGKTYAVSVPGNYEVTTTVTVNGKACVRRAGTVVYPATPTAKFTFTRSGLEVNFKNTSTGGDPYADPQSLTSAWRFDTQGTSATPATSTEPDGATNYSSSGLKLVSLTVTQSTPGCGATSTYTEQIPLPTATGPGWFGTDFTTQQQGLFAAYSAPNVVNTDVTFDYSACQYAVAKIAKTMVYDKTVALTFKGGPKANGDNPIDVAAYPYARFRIKIVPKAPATTLNTTTLFPNGLRVDLVDTSYKATGGTQANLVYLKGPRNADGSYQPIPVNEWFVSTLSFEGKLSNIKSNVTLQLAFTPFNDLPAGSSARQDFEIHVDWATVGNKDIPKPAPILTSGTAYVCSTSPTYPVTGAELDSCNTEKVTWADGYTKFARVLGPGTYTVSVSNFAGTESRTITVASTEPAVAKLSYAVVAAAPNASVQPYDNSTGKISRWYWHRTTSATATTSANTLAGYNAATSTLLYSVTTATSQTAEPTPAPGRKTSVTYTGGNSEYLCLAITPQVQGCVTTNKACVLIDWTITSTDKELGEATFAVYPTVVTDNRLNIQLGTHLQGAYDVQVMNVSGNQVATSKAISGNNEITLDSNLPAGTYIVKVSQGDKTITKRFIKQ